MAKLRTRKKRRLEDSAPAIQDSVFQTRSFTAQPKQSATNSDRGHHLGEISVYPVQAKLTIGEANDPYEQEADQMAAKVVNSLDNPGSATPSEIHSIQTKSSGENTESNDPLEHSIEQSRGSGEALPDDTRESMERSFGTDFSEVRVHTDAQADSMNRSINARAFTTGQDVYFRQGEYDLSSQTGKVLLAHELTHVVQQNSQSPTRAQASQNVQRQPKEGEENQSKSLPDKGETKSSINTANLLATGANHSEIKGNLTSKFAPDKNNVPMYKTFKGMQGAFLAAKAGAETNTFDQVNAAANAIATGAEVCNYSSFKSIISKAPVVVSACKVKNDLTEIWQDYENDKSISNERIVNVVKDSISLGIDGACAVTPAGRLAKVIVTGLKSVGYAKDFALISNNIEAKLDQLILQTAENSGINPESIQKTCEELDGLMQNAAEKGTHLKQQLHTAIADAAKSAERGGRWLLDYFEEDSPALKQGKVFDIVTDEETDNDQAINLASLQYRSEALLLRPMYQQVMQEMWQQDEEAMRKREKYEYEGGGFKNNDQPSRRANVQKPVAWNSRKSQPNFPESFTNYQQPKPYKPNFVLVNPTRLPQTPSFAQTAFRYIPKVLRNLK
ncbi:hypothetical protein LEP3755_12090 [Leptolyngbya sp. NIES-3755]|nr:hypothetical protein LEP3755_12090 [Leptolyngbya sp. NIES-3755]